MKRFFRKLKDRRGTTLVELLAAVGILVLFSVIVDTGLDLSLHSYHTMLSDSESKLLLSTASARLIDELRYARNIRTDGDGAMTQYWSEVYGPYAMIDTQEGRLVINVSGSPLMLLPEGVYGRDGCYGVEFTEKISYDEDTGIFSFGIKIDGGAKEVQQDFKVHCINAAPSGAAGPT